MSGQALLLSYTPFGSNNSVIEAGKGGGTAQWSEGNERGVSLPAPGSEPRDVTLAAASVVTYVTSEKNITTRLAKPWALPNLIELPKMI